MANNPINRQLRKYRLTPALMAKACRDMAAAYRRDENNRKGGGVWMTGQHAYANSLSYGEVARRLERQAEWWDERAINCTERCRTMGCVNSECPGERA